MYDIDSTVMFMFVNFVCLWIGVLITLSIWVIKYTLEKQQMKKLIAEGWKVDEEYEKLQENLQMLQAQLKEEKDNEEFLAYLSISLPTIEKYTFETLTKMNKLSFKLEKKSNQMDETFATMQMFMKILSFGCLRFTDWRDNTDE